jgi:hypothetical protein
MVYGNTRLNAVTDKKKLSVYTAHTSPAALCATSTHHVSSRLKPKQIAASREVELALATTEATSAVGS